MSSLRNAVKRITHKERPQPTGRNAGFLEKKVDYKQRANDYHRKEQRVKALKKRAAMRNPDEFYFGMHRAQVDDSTGKHKKTSAGQDVDDDTIKLLKDQDLAFIRTQRQKDLCKIQKLESNLHYIGDDSTKNKKRKHTIFVETSDEVKRFDAAQHFDTLPELVKRAHNRPRKQDLINNNTATSVVLPKSAAKATALAYKELQARKDRMQKLERAEAHLVVQKNHRKKGQKKLVKPAQDGEPAQYVWKQRRLG